MLVGIVAVLTAVVVVLLWLMHRKDEDIKLKNDVIIHEVRRNQAIIDKAVQQGLHRSTLLMIAAVAMMTAMSAPAWAWDGSGTSDDPYLIKSSADWQTLSANVDAGNSYSGQFFRLTQDIDIGSVSIGNMQHQFSGTFDGDNHTLTYNIGTVDNAINDCSAPFTFVSGCTIRHLHTTGTIYTRDWYCSGIVARICGPGATYLTDCHSSVRIWASYGSVIYNGGLVGQVQARTAIPATDSLVIDRCSYTGALLNQQGTNRECGGLVGSAEMPVTVRNSVFDPQDWNYYTVIMDGATFVRSDDSKVTITLENCYATMQMKTRQGTFVLNDMSVPEGVTFEFQGEPDVTLNGKGYWKNGCRVKLTVPEGTAFNHWDDNNRCFISDPWTANGIHQFKDMNNKPILSIVTKDIPKAETERTLWGVTYRYLSRQDYRYFVSDEECKERGWTFENSDDDANLIVKNAKGEASEITAITGYKESDYNDDGVQIHNDLVGDWRNHTHLGLIAPHAFKNSKQLKSLYFKDTDANNYNARTEFDFTIGEGAFEGCTNFKELKMMQYTTRGTNHWEALKPGQVRSISDDAFSGCTDLSISVQADKYQDYMNSAVWKPFRSRLIVYEATTEDFTVNGVKYHWFRSTDQTKDLKNDDDGKSKMLDQIRMWNADYQEFSAASLLDTKDDCNVYYASIIGVNDSDIDGAGGTMRIYNDPGSYYNYKTIQLQRDAIAGNTHVKNIEFYQTNGRSENSYSGLKMVIPNGAFKGCKNLKELRMFYYVQDGEDRWTALGPKDVIPGDNIFGEPSDEERQKALDQAFGDGDPDAAATPEQIAAIPQYVPNGFKILVASELYPEFLKDKNWLPYISYLEPTEFMPSGKNKDFTEGGLTYGYMTAPGGISQASSVVSQDVSWWTAPRIGIEVLLYAASIYNTVKTAATAAATVEEEAIKRAKKTVVSCLNGAITTEQAYGNKLFLQTWVNDALATKEYQKFFDILNGRFVADFVGHRNDITGHLWTELLATDIIDASKTDIIFRTVQGAVTPRHIKIIELFKEYLTKAIPRNLETIAIDQAELESARMGLASLLAKQAAIEQAYVNFPSSVARNFGQLAGSAALFSVNNWGGSGTYNTDLMNKGMRENILSNIHQVGLVGGGYVITTPQKNLVYHTYIKSVGNDVTDAVIYAGFDNDNNVNTSNRTMTFDRTAFRDKTKLKTVKFHEISGQTSNTGMPMLLTIPDSAFVGCTALTEFSTLLETDENGTRALGPENFILGGDSIFAGLDSLKFHIIIDPTRKQDFLDNASWKPLARYFKYESAAPAAKYKEYGAQYAYAYELNSIKKENKVSGHLIEHTVVIGPDDDFIKGHQGAVKLCNDIGTYNNYQLDEVIPGAFKGNKNLRSVSFVDLYGAGAFGDCYTKLQVHIGDSAFVDCTNLADLDLLYMETDGINKMTPMTPQMISIGRGVFDGTAARLKMMPQQVAWFEADSTWAKYKDRFMPCVIKVDDDGVTMGIRDALKEMAYYDPANTGTDPAKWDYYIDYARIAGAGFSWLDGKFTAQKDNIYSYADFRWFESVGLDYVGKSWFDGCSKLSNITLPSTVKTIRSKAFNGCSALKEIELPEAVAAIEDNAFGGCSKLNTVLVRGEKPATLGNSAFHKHNGLKIYVPAAKVNEYKQRWSEYAAYIVGDDTYSVNKVVTVTAVGQLAEKLGLTVTKESSKIHYIQGPYAKYDSLTVIGPLNGDDVGVLRHMMGADAYDSDITDGQLRYLNLWNADLKKDTEHSYNGYGVDEYLEKDNWVGEYMFHNCNALETVILPKSVTEIGENTFQEAYGLKRIAVGRNTTKYTRDLLQDLNGIEELVFLTEAYASSESSDPWEAPIQMVYTLPSQLGDYMGDPGLTCQAQCVMNPLTDDDIMWALADKGHFFPSEYLQLESVEGIFSGNTFITDMEDFALFSNVKQLDNAFNRMTRLNTISLPGSIERIGADAFRGCIQLNTIYVSSDSVPDLAPDAFKDLPKDFKILVPKSLCKRYREKWAQYADHINMDSRDYSGNEIMTVTVTEPNTLAQALGLTATTKKVFGSDSYVNSLKGDYSNIYRLKVVGPISGGDLDVLTYLAGYCKWATCRNYSGRLEYLDLYDAQIKESDVAVDGYRREAHTFMASEDFYLYHVDDNALPRHSFLRSYNLKTLILPRTCKEVNERALQECEGLETLVLGDDMEDFNWNALDDDAMLTRMYLLAKKKVKISTEWAVWRWLCNNYNPTFDAFYVRPSLYQEYLYDDAYTGSSWQRTNNVSKGAFNDDESFAVFAAHAAATTDDLMGVSSVDGWFDNHTGVKDLTPLGYTSVGNLRAADMQKLTKLEKIVLPITLETVEDGVFEKAADLRYVDMLLCDSTLMVDKIKAGGLTKLGIDTLRTLVYLPQEYGEAKGVNIVVDNNTKLHAETFRLVDGKDYCVPYAFEADKVENTRQLPASSVPYSVCLPYELDIPAYTRAYELAERDGTTLTFREVAAGTRLQATKPYLLAVVGNKRMGKNSTTLDTDIRQTIPASNTAFGQQTDVLGYSLRGTLQTIGNAKAAELGAYILQSSGNWQPVAQTTDADKQAYVPAFRAYLLPSARNAAARISMTLEDYASGIDTIETIDTDGTRRYYDLNGRMLPGKPDKGVYIYKGKKVIK